MAEPGKMCVEAAVCYALGLSHGDDPGCVSAPLRRLKIKLNDSAWSSDTARANGLRRLALAQLGSRDVLDDKEFIRRVVDVTIRRVVPAVLRSAATLNPQHAATLETSAVQCEQERTRGACLGAKRSAYAAADAASYAAYSAFYAAFYAADAASYAADAAFYAADAASADSYAYVADYAAYVAKAAADAAYVADGGGARDKSLAHFAELVVQILIDMQAPGCQWLYLVPKEGA